MSRASLAALAVLGASCALGYAFIPTNLLSHVTFMLKLPFKGGVLHTGQAGDGREQALLQHVLIEAPAHDTAAAIAAIDSFAVSTSWLMNVGDVKGKILDEAFTNASAKTTLELGTYMAYGSLRIAQTLQQPGSRHFTVEAFKPNYEMASAILKHAGVTDKVHVVHGTVAKRAIEQLREAGATQFDGIFLDHWKDLYRADLEKLLEAGMLRKGGVVVADNILFPGAPAYRKWINAHQDFKTTEHRTQTEYISFLPDIVTVSIYKPS